MKTFSNTKEAQLFAKILFNFAGYKDYWSFIHSCNFSKRQDSQKLIYFLDRRISPPKSRATVDLDYVILQTDIIELMANELDLSEAVEYHARLQDYLSSIENKKKDYERAQLYAYLFDAILGDIERDTTKIDIAFDRANRAMQLKDTALYLNYAVLACHKYVYTRDLEGYN